jgi:hypothetical protein
MTVHFSSSLLLNSIEHAHAWDVTCHRPVAMPAGDIS